MRLFQLRVNIDGGLLLLDYSCMLRAITNQMLLLCDPKRWLLQPENKGRSYSTSCNFGSFFSQVPPAVAPHRSEQIQPQPPPRKPFLPPPTGSHPYPGHLPNEVAIEVSPHLPEPIQPAVRVDEDQDDDLLSTVSSAPTVEHFNISVSCSAKVCRN